MSFTNGLEVALVVNLQELKKLADRYPGNAGFAELIDASIELVKQMNEEHDKAETLVRKYRYLVRQVEQMVENIGDR